MPEFKCNEKPQQQYNSGYCQWGNSIIPRLTVRRIRGAEFLFITFLGYLTHRIFRRLLPFCQPFVRLFRHFGKISRLCVTGGCRSRPSGLVVVWFEAASS